MIDSHQWAINLNAESKVEDIIEMDFYKVIAISISDFLLKLMKEGGYGLVA